jgi:hypothetical protein
MRREWTQKRLKNNKKREETEETEDYSIAGII